MRNTMISEQQYQALVARSGGPSRVSSQFLPSQSSDQYFLRKLYGDRVAPHLYHSAVRSSLERSSAQYVASNRRADKFPDSQDMRTQLAAERQLAAQKQLIAERQLVAERRGALLPSPPMADYSPPAYRDHIDPRGLLPGSPISTEVMGGAYRRFPLSNAQRAGQRLSNAELELAARAQRSETGASYPIGGYGNELQRTLPPPARDEAGGLAVQAAGILGHGGALQAAGILGQGGASRSRDLDRYLLQVQPEKLARYAASVVASDPALRRSSYPIVGNNLNPEDDPYSNYRRAKARRTGSEEFGGGGEPISQRDRERDIYRERGRRRESGRERRKRSPDTRERNGSLSKRNNDSNRVDHVKSTSHSSDGRRGQQNGEQSKRSRPSENSQKEEKRDEPKGKVVSDLKSDNDSELGSLCADLSDSDEEKVEKKSEEAATVIDGPLAGMIFGCSSVTFHECMKLQLFGLPSKSKDDVMRVTPGTKVFLFNFDTKELSGIFEAVSHGGWQIQPEAFRDFGGFPAQVQVCVSEQCPNIPQSVFRRAIKENYVSQTRFRFDLNTEQVRDLVRMFRHAKEAERNLLRQPDPSDDHYLSARLLSQDYLSRGGQLQIPYPRHPQARFGTSTVPYARVISMSTKTSIRKSRRASKRALKGRKKRKVFNRPESPMSDNCSLDGLSGEIQKADVAINTSGCEDTSNTNNAVIVMEGIETGNFRNVDQHKAIGETPAAKGIAPSGPDHGLSPSKPEEFAHLQNDLGTQVSFLEDSYNDGTFRLAGSRADEQGQGMGLDVLQGPLSSGNVIKSLTSTLSSMGEGYSEVRENFRTTEHAVALMNLEGNNLQQVASSTDGNGELFELDEKRNREGLGDIPVSAHDSRRVGLDTFKSVPIKFSTGGELPKGERDEAFLETMEVEADRKLNVVGKNKESEVIATEVTTGPGAPYVREDAVVTAGVVRKNEEFEVILAEVVIGPEVPCVREEMVVAGGIVGKDEELQVIAAKVAVDSEAPSVTEEVMISSGLVSEDEELEVLAAEVPIDPQAFCVGEKVTTVVGVDVRDEVLEVIAAEVARDSKEPCVSEEVMTAAGAAGEEEVKFIADEVAVYSETVSLREEVLIAAEPVCKHEDLELISAEFATHCEALCVREEMKINARALGKDEELDEDALDPDVRQEVEIAAEAACEDEELEVNSAKGTLRSIVRLEIAAGTVGKDEELALIASEVALDSKSPFDREDVVMVAGTVPKNQELEVLSKVALDSEAHFDRENVVTAAGAVNNDDDLEVITADVHVDFQAAFEQEEVVIAAWASAKDRELEMTASGLATNSAAPSVREEVMIAARPLSSQLPASANIKDKVTIPDDIDQGEEVLAANAANSEQPSPDLDVTDGDDEDEEEVLLTDNAVDSEHVTSADEDGNDVVEEQDYDNDEGEGDGGSEDEETVDVSVDGELSNVEEDGDKDQEVGEGVDDVGSWDESDE